MQTSSQPSAADGIDAIELLRQDHKKVQMLFNDFESMRNAAGADAAGTQQIVRQICTELTIHAQIEEEIFYPAVRQGTDDDDLVDEAEEEHAEAKELIAELQSMQPDDARYAATVLALAKAVMHHVQEEENEMFVEAQGEIDTLALGRQLMQRKEALQQLGAAEAKS